MGYIAGACLPWISNDCSSSSSSALISATAREEPPQLFADTTESSKGWVDAADAVKAERARGFEKRSLNGAIGETKHSQDNLLKILK